MRSPRSHLLRAALIVTPLLVTACSLGGDGGDDAPSQESQINANPNAPDAPQTPAQTDQGCGGLNAPPCEDGKKCHVGKDCASLSCQQGVCAAATSSDGVKNADESDVDCGGASSPKCADGKACSGAASCTSGACLAGTCKTPTGDDGAKDGDESDVDCGGTTTGAARCAPGKACGAADDCDSRVCAGGLCQAPTGTDGVKNGDESDVDCGGATTGAPKCVVGKQCKAHADCATDGCGYDGKCAAGRSCTQHLGGDTCGAGEVGEPGASHETCCAQAPIAGSAAKIDKYLITAGRMRAFIDRVGGDVRGFVQTVPGWNPAWNAYVPSSPAEADMMLGSYWFDAPNDADRNTNAWSKRSCAPGQFGGHTYWTPKNGSDYSDFSKDDLDVKALNCVGWHLVRAFCAWDGGRMATRAEIYSAFTNGGTTSYPWGWHDARPFNENAQDPYGRLDHQFSYGFPDVPGMRTSGGSALDVAWYIAPPGRHAAGANKFGVEVAGDLLHWVSDQEYNFMWTFSWERHGASLAKQSWIQAWPGEPNGYYGIGGRCVHD